MDTRAYVERRLSEAQNKLANSPVLLVMLASFKDCKEVEQSFYKVCITGFMAGYTAEQILDRLNNK